ncbi:MAG: oligosaccharyl transferase, archaeosortase A system-associated [Methanogenium sp.]
MIKCVDKRLIIPYLLTIAIAIAVRIRLIPIDKVRLADGTILFSGIDSWYHYRNVEYILTNHTILNYDAFTNYPSGTVQIFAPLYDILLAVISILLNCDSAIVCMYAPVVIAACIIITIYYVTSRLFDTTTGILSAFILAVLPGQFLLRSLIGYNDHHAMEVLMSTMICYAILCNFKTLEQGNVKRIIYCAVITGLLLGCFGLMWNGALLFGAIVGVFFVIFQLVEHMRTGNIENITIVGACIFAVAAVVSLLIPQDTYRAMYVENLFLGSSCLIVIEAISRWLEKRAYPRISIFVVLASCGIMAWFALGCIGYAIPNAAYITGKGGAVTIAEVVPMFAYGFDQYWLNFAVCGYLAILGFSALLANTTRLYSPHKLFLLIWSLGIFWAMFQQERFAYYFAINVAILSAFIITTIINKSLSAAKKHSDVTTTYICAGILIGAVFYSCGTLSITQANYNATISTPWLDALYWLDNKAPISNNMNVELEPSFNEKLNRTMIEYPESTYGVLSWWDYGHWIQVIGHKPVVANPFQQGIGNNGVSGAAPFFTANSESAAIDVLDNICARCDDSQIKYIVTDLDMATGKFGAMTLWMSNTTGYFAPLGYNTTKLQQINADNTPTIKYYQTMIAKLHIFDGSGLSHFRLVYESSCNNDSVETDVKWLYNQKFNQTISTNPTGNVKIFEFVSGAKIVGIVTPNTNVTCSKIITTNTGRSFEYIQQTKSDENGQFMLVLPYAGEYNINNQALDISESDVINGEIVKYIKG